MTMTVNSGSGAYCTPAQFVSIFDWRTFAQLASDGDESLNLSELQSSDILLTKLRIGAGLIEMAATVAARYSPADLAALIAAPISNSGYALIDLNASLAAAEMFGRRFESMPEFVAKKTEDAFAKLAALENGTAIFGFVETQQAGIVSDYKETPTDVEARNLPSFIVRRCLGRRSNRLLPP